MRCCGRIIGITALVESKLIIMRQFHYRKYTGNRDCFDLGEKSKDVYCVISILFVISMFKVKFMSANNIKSASYCNLRLFSPEFWGHCVLKDVERNENIN